MRTKCITLYTFQELSPEAQARAIERYRVQQQQDPDTYWAEPIIEDAETIAGLLGIELRYHDVPLMNKTTRRAPNIWWSLGYCQGDFACIEGTYSYAKGAHHNIWKHAPQDATLYSIACDLRDAQRTHGYKLTATITHHHNRGCQVETEPEDLRVKDAIRRFNGWIYDRLREADESRQTDEYIRETLENNDDEYDEHGSLET